MATAKIRRAQKYEIYNHRILGISAHKFLTLAKSDEIEGKYYALAAVLFSFMAFEGYLNWLGSRIAENVWRNERDFFSRPPFKGTLGKFSYLVTLLHLEMPDPSKGPYQTALEVHRLRDSIAHTTPEYGENEVEFPPGNFPPMYRGKLAKRITTKTAQRAVDDLQALAEELHCSARISFCDKVQELHAMNGFIGFDITDA